MGRKSKNYLCNCGETNSEQFYAGDKIKCKACILIKRKKFYANMSNEEKNAYGKKQKKWASNNLVKIRVLAAKHRANRKNLVFDIDEQFINELYEKQNYKCKYSGEILDVSSVGSDSNQMNLNSLSIDRIYSNKGYTKDNVVLVTAIVNIMKNDLSEIDFLSIIKKISDNKV